MLSKKCRLSSKKLTTILLVFLFLTQNVSFVFAADELITDNVNTKESLNNEPTPAVSSDSNIISPDVISENKTSEAKSSVSDLSPTSLSETPGSDSYDEPRKPTSNKLHIDSNPLTGGFAYSYPIVIPPGRNGFQPDLKLVYNNQDENNFNICGYGWSLSIPYIERINKKGVDTLFSQNYFNSSLTGEITQIGTSTSFSSKIDNGEFLNYKFINNTYWQVTDKKGYQYIFGLSASARQDNPANSAQVFKWMLEKVIDTNNNYVAYNYYKNNGQIYPDIIKYTGFNTTDDSYSIISKIKNSESYNNFVSKTISIADSSNLLSFDNSYFGAKKQGSSGDSLNFNSGDLLTSIGGTLKTNISGYRQDINSPWSLNIGIYDRYNFEFHGYGSYEKNFLVTTGNNLMLIPQYSGTVSNYDINIQFKDYK